jgi:hypothetical protein
MPAKSVKLETSYAVGAGDVSLTVIVGNAQFGTHLVKLDGQQLAIGDVNDLSIGKGLKGKTLTVKSIVTDINDMTNLTNIRYVLTGGSDDAQHDLEVTVDREGDSAVYRATFNLV